MPLHHHHHQRRRCLGIVLPFLLLVAAGASGARGRGVPDDPSATERTVCEVLRAHGLPIGLLPRGSTEFRIDEAGRFQVRLERACSAHFEDAVHYEANVTGTLSYGQIGALSGISAQDLFLWFPVKGIRVDVPSSGLIYFDVGVVRKQFPLSLFDTPPDCKGSEPPTTNLLEGREMAWAADEIKSGKLRLRDLDQEDARMMTIL